MAKPLQERFKGSSEFLDLEPEERPETQEAKLDVIPLGEHEREVTPESKSPVIGPAETPGNPDGEQDTEMRSPSEVPPQEEAPEVPNLDWTQVPIPGDSASEELEEWFGDNPREEEAMTCRVDSCWEVDVTPADWWELPEQLDEDMIFLASESRKKRVEVKLRDMTVKDQRRFAAAKHKEVSAWIAHKTVKRMVSPNLWTLADFESAFGV
ncbi:unnamed protein product, partial [Symbiodinium pilosum]